MDCVAAQAYGMCKNNDCKNCHARESKAEKTRAQALAKRDGRGVAVLDG